MMDGERTPTVIGTRNSHGTLNQGYGVVAEAVLEAAELPAELNA
ncbi:MAG: hypothetical protein Q7K41_06950 [Dehalococcoidales bacterium]|nr:hypothetical protein [Dehalococcoidales bacterium]